MHMLQTLSTYIPMDRRQAMAAGAALPEQAQGSAVFADISGFTPLTEVLTTIFGTRRGAEEITRYLNLIYDALIEEIHRYGGSVIGFSGDAILCWFNDTPDHPYNASTRAVAAASAMQRQMEHAPVITLPRQTPIVFALKIAVTTGAAHRFIVGDPTIQIIDVLAGSVVDRLSQAQHVAHKTEIALDSATLAQLQVPAELVEWRHDKDETPFAIIQPVEALTMREAWFADLPVVDESRLSAWLLPALRTRLREGLAEFETELRPATSLFVRFYGIDFEHDPDARTKLDAFVRHVQTVLALYEGTLLQVSLGDKGSYLYLSFGAPIAHEDDAARAVSVALELRHLPVSLGFIEGVRIGLAHGMMRVGSYGGARSRTYGVLGDDANLAARLMQKADMNEVIGTGRVQQATASDFMWNLQEPIQIKGKSKPITVAKLLGKTQFQLDPTPNTGNLFGREAELNQLIDFFQSLQNERFAGVAYLYGESGVGKSRLAHELKRQLYREMSIQWFTCAADTLLRRSLYPIKTLLREYFDQFERSSERGNKERFAFVFDTLLETASPALAQRLQLEKPFIGGLVDLHWPDSIYELADPLERFESTLWALRTFIEALSQQAPLILYFDNADLLDLETKHFLQFLVKHVRKARWGVVITGRNDEQATFDDLYQQGSIPHCSIYLNAFTAEVRRAFARQLLGGTASPEVIEAITTKTGGNPFFIEHLILNMQECGVVFKNKDGVWNINEEALNEVPVSISAVLMTRLDRLPPQVKIIVQYAAVLGQRFEIPVLAHMLGDDPHIMATIEQAERHAIWTKQDDNVAEFQHPLLRDTAYDSQLQAQLQERHAIAANAIEAVNAQHLDGYASDLAYHYGQAHQPANERKYAHMAGEIAMRRYSNVEALGYINRALELTQSDDPLECYQLLLLRENIHDVQGDRAAQQQDLVALVELAAQIEAPRQQLEIALRQANYAEATSNYRGAIAAAQRGVFLAQTGQDSDVEAASLLIWGRAEGWQANYPSAQAHLWRALELAQSSGHSATETACLRNLGIVAFAQGDYAQAETYQLVALDLSRSRADRRGESHALSNLARIASQRNQTDEAQHYRDAALQLSRATGDRNVEASVLNLSHQVFGSKTESESRQHHEESLNLSRQIGNRRGECTALYHLGTLLLNENDHARALLILNQSLNLAIEIGYKSGEIRVRTLLARLYHERENLAVALEQINQAVILAEAVGARPEQANALLVYGYLLLAQDRPSDAALTFEQAIQLWNEMGRHSPALEAQLGKAYTTLLRGDTANARQNIDTLLSRLEKADFTAMIDPLRVYLIAFRLLHALQDPRAQTILDYGHHILESQRTRHTSTKETPIQRELRAAWMWNDQM